MTRQGADFSYNLGWLWVAPELMVDRYDRRVTRLMDAAENSPEFWDWLNGIPAEGQPVTMIVEMAPLVPYRATVRRTKNGTTARIMQPYYEYLTFDRMTLGRLADRDFDQALSLVASRWRLPPHPPLAVPDVEDLDAWFPVS